MDKILLDFYKRPTEEQEYFLEETWCKNCNKADLGIIDPVEYIENQKIFIEGKCKKCGSLCKTEITQSN